MSTTPKIPFCWVEGDRLPEITCTYKDQDLTGYTVTLHVHRKDDSVIVINADPIDLLQGQVKFPWGVGDLVAGINQRCEIQFVDGAGLPLTSKLFLIDVREELA